MKEWMKWRLGRLTASAPVKLGDIADMMIDGDMCQCCGEYLGEGEGYPRTCSDCGGEDE